MPRRRSRFLSIVGGVSMGALLLLAGGRRTLSSLGSPGFGTGQLQQQLFFPPPEFLLPPPPELLLSDAPARQESEADLSFARRLLPNRRGSPPQHQDDAVLLPEGEVLVLTAEPAVGNAKCVFQGGVSSQARALGRLPGPGRHAYLCLVPDSVQQPLQAPRLLPSSAAAAPAPVPAAAALLNWSNTSLVFDSAVLDGGGDVLVFAKGRRQGLNAPLADLQCLYSGATVDGSMVASFPAIASAQQLVRCPPPPTSLLSGRITVAIKGDKPLPSLATFTSGPSVKSGNKKLICACTMVRNVAKFLPEWVEFHAAVGVESFYLYDNGSGDDLAAQVVRLQASGFSILTVAWPWAKTQEAGLSHCAAMHRSSCQWMAFIDVDEFMFSPDWKNFDRPTQSMLQAVVANVDPHFGQVYLPCYDFGPSGQTSHPREGVCQGYTCRLNQAQRHKSLVRLDAIDDSLQNSVHHFKLKSGLTYKWTFLARINHYKFQAWEEFKKKFERRVSAYVADWKDPVNLQSADRAPGLGVSAIEPPGWPESFCDRNDTSMKDTSIKWFGFAFRGRGQTGDISSSPSPSPSLL